jgi:hypothetical protein
MTRGRHGTGAIGAELGPVSGWVVDGVYVAGDTILCDEVLGAIDRHRPRAVIANGGGARFNDGDPIVMTAADVKALPLPAAVVHLEAINHCIEPRAAYRGLENVVVPDDGETFEL